MIARFCLVIMLVLAPTVPCLAQDSLSDSTVDNSPQPMAAPSPPVWPITISIENFGKQLEGLNNATTTVFWLVIKVGVFLVSLVLVQRLLWLMLCRRPELVIENFVDATGKTELTDVSAGLTQLARQKLIADIKEVKKKVKVHVKSVGPKDYRLSERSPLPQAAFDQRLAGLLSSIKEFSPEQFSPIFQLINILFPPFGTKVTGLLQSKGSSPETLGLTIEITDIQGKLVPQLYTIWEDSNTVSKDPQSALPQLTDKDRYARLLNPVSHWLALELSRREMIVRIPFGHNRKQYQAQIHNFFGLLNSASKSKHSVFNQLAKDDLKQAIELCPDWYQPYENLADFSAEQGRKEDGKNDVDMLRKAILNYGYALNLAKDDEDESITRRIKLGKATALLSFKDKASIDEASKEIKFIKEKWNPLTELNSRFLYNMAVWHLMYKSKCPDDQSAVQTARLYLTCSLARSRQYWNLAIKDSDLTEVRGDLPNLEFYLEKYLLETPGIDKCTDKRFEAMINRIFETMGWPYP